mgnify:CR=1 FL=1
MRQDTPLAALVKFAKNENDVRAKHYTGRDWSITEAAAMIERAILYIDRLELEAGYGRTYMNSIGSQEI